MESITWEALPPRKKQKSSGFSHLEGDGSADGGRATVRELVKEKIEENIAARSRINRQQTTLESKDGCAGEFYEYLDHTADVQCHAWGSSMIEAFEHMGECMINYMTDVLLIDVDPDEDLQITVSGHDMDTLLYNYMNEILVKFISDTFCTAKVKITHFDREKFTLTATL
eukprot:gene27242-32912_t